MHNIIRWAVARSRSIFATRHAPAPTIALPTVPTQELVVSQVPASSPARQHLREAAVLYENLAIQQRFYEALLHQETASEADPTDHQAMEAIDSIFHAEHVRIASIPRMPYIIPQLMRDLRDEDTSQWELSALIKKDPAIAGEVLRLANSAFFRRTARPTTSIEQAIAILGFNGIRTMVSNVLMKPILQFHVAPYKNFFQLIWQHSIQCAYACQHLAQQRSQDAFTAYFVGLIHDIGAIVSLKALLTHYKKIGRVTMDISLHLQAFLSKTAPRVSTLVAQDWDLPAPLVAAIEAQSYGHAATAMHELGDILFWGNMLSELAFLERLTPQDEQYQALNRSLQEIEELHETYLALQKNDTGALHP